MSGDEHEDRPPEEGRAVTQEQYKKLMEAIGNIRKEIKSLSVETVESVSRRLKRDRDHSYQFRKKGNRLQHEFNEDIMGKFEESDAILSKIPAVGPAASITEAREKLKEGTQLLASRQKHIKMADRSELDWAVVSEYETDALADDSDDERKIEKAEKAAERKMAAARKKKASPKLPAAKFQKLDGIAPATTTQQQVVVKPATRYPGTPAVRPIGPCHQCYEYGHLKRNCPLLSTMATPKTPASTYPRTYPHGCVSETSGHVVQRVEEVNAMGREVSEKLIIDGDKSSHTDTDSVLSVFGDCLEGEQIEHRAAKFDACLRDWEYEACQKGILHPPVKGRLKERVDYWINELEASPFIVDTIKNGYPLPMLSVPPWYSHQNDQSALVDADFVDDALTKLLADECIKETGSESIHVCSPLMVVTNDNNKKRLVINLKYLNNYLVTYKFRYEDLRAVLALVKKGDYMFSFDLKSGYHHVDIREGFQKYLGFSWATGGKQKYYVFTVLPFGLSSACYMFTKLLRPIVRYWRANGLRIVVYLDDGIGLEQQHEAAAASKFVQDTLHRCGLVANVTKSQWEPTSRLQWLGFDLNIAEGTIRVPEQKVSQLKVLLIELKQQKFAKARMIAKVTGKLISMWLGLGSTMRLMSRSLYSVLQTRTSWSDVLCLDANCLEEIEFWQKSINAYNGQPLWLSS